MAMTFDSRRRSHSKFKRTESIEFRLIFVTAFAAFFVAAIVERLLPRGWLSRSARGGERLSVFAQAKQAANTCAAYAFMG